MGYGTLRRETKIYTTKMVLTIPRGTRVAMSNPTPTVFFIGCSIKAVREGDSWYLYAYGVKMLITRTNFYPFTYFKQLN